MKPNTKLTLYFFSLILLLLVSLLLGYAYSSVKWDKLFNASLVFLSFVIEVALSVLFASLAVYYFKKARGHGKEKKHVRFL